MPNLAMARVACAVVFVAVTGAALAQTPAGGASKPAATSTPDDKTVTEYAAKLAAIEGKPLVQRFMLGQEIAKLPPESGWTIMRENWGKLSEETKKQMIKAWSFKAKEHPYLRDVQNLGANDGSVSVKELAEKLVKDTEGGKTATPAPAKDSRPDAPPADIADIPFQDLRAGGDENRRYFLIGPRPGAKPPPAGYRLVLVLPGGEGNAEFRPFVQRILKNALSDDCVIAQLVAPKWARSKEVVWPTAFVKDADPKMAAEDFMGAVVKDAQGRLSIDAKRIDALGWSSGGPPVYAATLRAGTPLRGAFVAMSVFKPDELPTLAGAAGHRFYILHSPQDFIKMSFPEDAKAKLTAAGGRTTLKTYEGGHGWRGDVFGNIRDGLAWLEKPGD